MNNAISYSLIMFLAGLGIPIMATLNGGLAVKLNSPALAATILFSVGLVVAVIYLIFTEGVPSMLYVENTPWYFYSGGCFVMFYILSISWVAPGFGISNAVAFVLLGQLVAMSLIDHFGLIGAAKYTVNIRRIVGLVLMAIGVFLTLNKK